MANCDGCTFCCWSFAVRDVPQLVEIKLKEELTSCPQLCETGCRIHGTEQYPTGCKEFICPYLIGEPTHRPDTFQKLLMELKGNMGNIIPSIPWVIPVLKAEELIRSSRTIMASFVLDGAWHRTVIPLDREENGSWLVRSEPVNLWNGLFKKYGMELVTEENKEIEANSPN